MRLKCDDNSDLGHRVGFLSFICMSCLPLYNVTVWVIHTLLFKFVNYHLHVDKNSQSDIVDMEKSIFSSPVMRKSKFTLPN